MNDISKTFDDESLLRELDDLDGPDLGYCPAGLADNKDKLIGLLASVGATSLVVEYDGSDDSGAIEEIICRGPGDAVIELPPEAVAAVEDFVYASLPDGWEIDGGGFGSVEFDIAGSKVHYAHAQRCVDVFESEWEV